MEGLQRSSETFRRSGSSGLVWEDRFISEISNEPKKSEQGAELKKSRSVGSGGGAVLDTTGYKTGRVSPTMDPPSPKVSACGFCGAFSKKGAAKKKGNNFNQWPPSNYLGQFYHPNLIKLIGYCLEDDHRLLVYEFMPRGSLENHIFRRGSYFQPLSWNLRMKVALGAAKGLAFLHCANTKVIYRDFKTSNVLLDSNYNAKLSDFGLAKDGSSDDKSHVSMRIMGTYGYAAPEYLATCK